MGVVRPTCAGGSSRPPRGHEGRARSWSRRLASVLLWCAPVNMLANAANAANAVDISEHQGFEPLVRPHLNDLFVRALRFERSPVEAWDLVQDTLERGL